MRFESRTWFILSLVLFAGAIYFWKRGNELESRKARPIPPVRQPVTNRAASAQRAPAPPAGGLLSQSTTSSYFAGPLAAALKPAVANLTAASVAATAAPVSTNFPFRLSNTTKKLGELTRTETAVLMRNALIDTAEGTTLPIPEHLRAQGDPGSYIVQAKGPIGAGFRQRLQQAGAAIVAYIPNNAYFVTVGQERAQWLAGLPDTQAVLPYEPYYKLETKLLGLAVEQKPLAEDDALRVTAFPGQGEILAQSLQALGAEVLGQERTPFGPQLLVKPAPDTLPEIANLAATQTIELSRGRELLNDLTRVAMGISENATAPSNYLGLSGANVLVNVNDSGVDASNPDLAGRVFADDPARLQDLVGHGTHVAGIIAGSGASSSTVAVPPQGSETNADFRGMAPGASIFALRFSAAPAVNRFQDDTYLQETAARTNATYSRRRTGPMISNNSWGYINANEYDSSSARFDAAVRDAVPEGTNSVGPQPIIYVFSAGNSGEGTDLGEGGEAASIPSPGNAKNVITVGALEHLRNLTNGIVVTNGDTVITNQIFSGLTDSSDEVASYSSRGNVGIGQEGEFGRFKPDLVAPGTFIVSPRSKDWHLEADFDTNSPQYKILKELNDPLAPNYRFETGTSQAAPVISGLLALMQEFFEQRLGANLRRTNSPALMKALLINGARSVNPLYDLQVQNSINYQGWGQPNITNILPSAMLSQPETAWPVRIFDQHPTNALGTGESRSWNVSFSTNTVLPSLRVTLVWTDPPGNPTAAIKLVNDLDLVVSNTVTHEVYYGNDIPAGSDFTHATLEETPVVDYVNNVENVFIRDASTNYVVTVRAKRVNVAAVTDYHQVTRRTNDVVQDFALVISTGDPSSTNAFSDVSFVTPEPALPVTPVGMTNGLPLLNQRAGANSPLLDNRHGLSNQWNFYVFTNIFFTNSMSTMTNGTNVAFVTFLPPNVSRSRYSSADIDLYVSKDPGLVQLNPAVVDTAWKSLSRGGTEYVVFTNAAIGDIFYIGVKSEDQQAGEYGLIALSSDQPFEENRDGYRVLHGMPVPQSIPDGTPSQPGRATVFAIGISPITIQNVAVTNILTHQDVGDLAVLLDHDQTSVALHNHSLNDFFGANVTNFWFIYDDSIGLAQSAAPNGYPIRRSDGPGSLQDFVGQEGTGVWMMNLIDSAPNRTGAVQSVTIQIEPFNLQDLAAAGAQGIRGTVAAGDAACYFIDVPPEATNLVLTLDELSGPLEVYISSGTPPTTNSYTKTARIDPPGGVVTLGWNDDPPLTAGRNYVCLYNPGTSPVDFHLVAKLEIGVGIDFERKLGPTNVMTLRDDGVITSTVTLPVDKQVQEVQVAVRIDHPRSSDLVLHLTSPQGTRLLLSENRGGSTEQGYGTGTGTNLTYTIFTEDTNLVQKLEPVKFTLPPWTNLVTGTNPAVLFDGFEQATPGVYTNGDFVSAWDVVQGQVQVHGPGNTLGIQAHTGTNFLELDTTRSAASIITTVPTVPGKDYELSFAYQKNPSANRGVLSLYYGPPLDFRPPTKFVDASASVWQKTNIVFTASSNLTQIEISSLTSAGPLIDSVRIGDVVTHTNVYMLPEESLKVLQGERAQGDWTLEIWDNRRGPTGTGPGTLIDWQLQVQYGNPAGRGTVLTNSTVYLGQIEGNETNYFVVDVCDTSTAVFATVEGPYDEDFIFPNPHLQLLVDRESYPTGNPETDDFYPIVNDQAVDLSARTGVASFGLTTDPHYPAPLLPGKRLFFAVHNLNAFETNDFSIRVVFNNDTCSPVRPIIRLTNDIPYTNIVAPSGVMFDYYVFNVSPAALQAQFEAIPQAGDIGLVARYGLPLPDLTTFDYQSDLPGLTNELIVITNGSAPVNLLPGDWYLGVYNNTTNATRYSIRASQVLDTNINLIPLTNGVSLDYTLRSGAALTNYFLLEVPDPYLGLKFDLFNLTGDADLLIGFNTLPNATNYYSSNSASPTQPINLEIRTNDTLPDLRGNWVLSVVPKNPATNLSFTVRGSFITETNQPPTTNRVFDPDITVTKTNICLSWDATVGLQYRLEAKTSVTDTNWTVLFGPETATTTRMSHCIDLPSPFFFFRVVELGTGEPVGPGQIIEPELTVTTNSICLAWDTTVGRQYRVEGLKTVVDTNWDVLFGPEIATGTRMTHCIDLPSPYFFFRVVELGTEEPPTGGIIDPDVSVTGTSICLSWPAQVGQPYRVQGMTTIVDTAWANVSPVFNATNTVITYCIPRPTPYQFFQVLALGGGGTNEPPPEPILRTLEPGVTQTNVLRGLTNILDYYRYTASPAAVQARFTIRPLDGDPGVLLSATGLPDQTQFDQRSDQAGLVAETLVVTNGLQNGDLYLGVYNKSEQPIRYEVTVTEVLDTRNRVITLTNGVPLDFTLLAGSGLTNFFQLKVPDAAPSVRFEVTQLTGNANVLVAYGVLPSPTVFVESAFGSPTVPADISINTNAVFTDIHGYWVAAVQNQTASNLSFRIRASYPQSTNTVPGTNSDLKATVQLSSGTNLCLSWPATAGRQYRVDGKQSITQTNWTVLDGPRTVTGATGTFCTNKTGGNYFFRIVELGGGGSGPGGSTNEVHLEAPLVLGNGGLQLVWQAQVGATYEVQFTTNLVPQIVWMPLRTFTATRTETVTVTDTNAVTSGPMKFYRVIQK